MRQLALSLVLLGAVPAPAHAQSSLRDQVLTAGVSEEVVIANHPPLSLRAMASTAGAVVRVSVRNSDAFLSNDGSQILTDYRMAVVDVVKESAGTRISAGDVITVRRIGGVATIEGRRVISNESGFAPFSNGTEYVLFLKTDSGQPYEVLAGSQSAFRVHQGTIIPMSTSNDSRTALALTLFLNEVRDMLVASTSLTQ